MDEEWSVAVGDDTLLERVRRGDRDAAAALMQQNNRALWRLARGILGDDGEAEEVVQETYLRGFGALDTFRGESSFATWLARIVVNEALRRLQRRRPTIDIDELAESALLSDETRQCPAVVPSNPEQAAARAEIRRMIERAVDRLPPPFRTVFMMRVLEQMTVEETVAVLGIPEATVKTRLWRANLALRSALGADLADAFADAFPFGGARCERLTAGVLAKLPQTTSGAAPARSIAVSGNLRRFVKMLRSMMAAAALLSLFSTSAPAAGVDRAPPPAPFRKVSELVKLPDFLPGLGTLYVDPQTLPAGPFLAYDHNGRLVSTVYMIPMKVLDSKQGLDNLKAYGDRVDDVDLYYNAGHPGVPEPHYHIVLWHVPKADEAAVAK